MDASVDDESRWIQLVIQPPGPGLSGAAAYKLFSLVGAHIEARLVVLWEPEDPILVRLVDRQEGIAVLSLEYFLGILHGAPHLEWGDFFLCSSTDSVSQLLASRGSYKPWGGEGAVPYKRLLPHALATIRAVDDGYFYIYTVQLQLYHALKLVYPDLEYKSGTIEDLDFPA
ncbi:MAG: hypothetical protein GXP27_22650 [Planctomycetes bacterium]|nr:hypothetical protein [Planctomycetota bacterium]